MINGFRNLTLIVALKNSNDKGALSEINLNDSKLPILFNSKPACFFNRLRKFVEHFLVAWITLWYVYSIEARVSFW